MLTSDLVLCRRKGDELLLRAVDDAMRRDAVELATRLLEAARAGVGSSREELDAAFADAVALAREPRLAAGVRKLAEDACEFEAMPDARPVELRRALFTRAARARREAPSSFSRDALIAEVAAAEGLTPESLSRALFSDLRGEHLLVAAPELSASALAEAWEHGQAQAVLLTAVRVTIELGAVSPGALRAFFAKLKFHQLLFSLEREGAGFRVVIDGPISMFEAVSKYGLRLALLVPALSSLEEWTLTADIRWGKERRPLVFRLSSGARDREAGAEPLFVSDEVRALAEGIGKQAGWRAEPTTEILDVPGLGVCVPDLLLVRADGARLFVEVLGYWSRDAVWRRVELSQRGLRERLVFAVSAHLRVSQDVIPDDVPAALYVYKRTMSARALLERAEKVLAGASSP